MATKHTEYYEDAFSSDDSTDDNTITPDDAMTMEDDIWQVYHQAAEIYDRMDHHIMFNNLNLLTSPSAFDSLVDLLQ